MPAELPQRSKINLAAGRRYRRFDLQFPALLSFPSKNSMQELDAISKNVSLGGMLLEVNRPLPAGTRVAVKLAVATPESPRPVQLMGEGKVVRVYSMKSGAGFAVAVECERPMTQVRGSGPGPD